MTNPTKPIDVEDTLRAKIQEVLDMQKVVMLEHNGRPDCKNCSLAETLQEILNKEKTL